MGNSASATAPAGSLTTSSGGYKDRPWIPRFWDGINITGWFRLAVKNRVKVGLPRVGMAILLSVLSLFNSLLGVIQSIIWGRRIRRTPIDKHPIFILGHWRSGTTLLHELLVLDQRHTFPNTYACFAPNHYLLSRKVIPPVVGFLMPTRRPMDNMAAGWDRPQEDEFALCNMGVPSPYLTMAFPNEPPQDQEYLTLEDLPPRALARWKRALVWFLKCVTLADPKRIVLKSPPHTCRIKPLLEVFPKARFVHIVRDPFVIFPSTVNLWKRLYKDQGLQVPRYRDLEERVFRTFERMYEVFERQRSLIPPGQFCEVRFEDLIADPIGQMHRVYDELELGQFDQTLPAIEQYLEGQADYKPNRYQISPEIRAEIVHRWGDFMVRYGYAPAAEQDAA